jgi:hypothetical protein
VDAEFVVWLEGQDLPPRLQRRHHGQIERWMRWQAGADDGFRDPPEMPTQWVYYERLRRSGVGDIELGYVRTALSSLGRYHVTEVDRGRTVGPPPRADNYRRCRSLDYSQSARSTWVAQGSTRAAPSRTPGLP